MGARWLIDHEFKHGAEVKWSLSSQQMIALPLEEEEAAQVPNWNIICRGFYC